MTGAASFEPVSDLPAPSMVDLAELMRRLADLVNQFEALAPGRAFTPDGHMVGSIGELIASTEHDLVLTTASTKGVDATRQLPDGTTRTVEIKTTTRKSFAFRHWDAVSDDVIAIILNIREGTWETVYNGPAAPIWAALRPTMPSNGQRVLSAAQLRTLGSQG